MKIEKLPSGNYRLRVYLGKDANGKRITKSFTHYDKGKLRLIAAQYETSHGNAVHAVTVEEAIDTFLTAKTAVLSPSTVRGYNSCARVLKSQHARFCALQIDSVQAKDVQMLVNDLVNRQNSPKTIRNYHGFLSAVFKYSGELLPPVTLPQRERPEICIPDEDTFRAIMDAAKGTRLEIPLALAAFGLRRSEIIALDPADINGNVIHVHRAVVYGDRQTVHVKTTKTYTSDRYIQIPDALADKIRNQGFVTDMTLAAFTQAFDKFLRRNGFPHFRLHDLRHYLVSYCHNVLHLSDAQIQAITGHKTSVIMRTNYLHSMNQQTANQILSDSLSKII